MIARLMIDKRPVLRLLALLAAVALVFGGLAAGCSDNNRSGSGLWQGGGDSEPGWR
jgi:hypothetical protein